MNIFKGSEAVITFGSGENTKTLNGWVDGTLTSVVSINLDVIDKPKLRLRKKSKCAIPVKTEFEIKGHSFSKYVHRLFEKHGVGFIPSQDYKHGRTDRTTFIQAPVPRNEIDFLVMAHEVGHIKSKQYEREREDYSYWTETACDAMIENELNAWLWGLRYFRRLGFKLCNQGKKSVADAFYTYTKVAKNPRHAQRAWNILYEKFGINEPRKKDQQAVIVEHYHVSSTDSKSPNKPVFKKIAAPSHKPWHDLKQKQTKKQWKNQR